jgi:hypothetical protein
LWSTNLRHSRDRTDYRQLQRFTGILLQVAASGATGGGVEVCSRATRRVPPEPGIASP